MSSGILRFNNTKYISENEHIELSKRCHPQKGDLLLSKVGTTGIPLIIETEKEFSIFVSLALIKFTSIPIDKRFLIHLINSPLVQEQVQENTRGVGNKNWVLTAIANTLILLPPLNEQLRISDKIDELSPIISKYAMSQQRLENLNANINGLLRKSILQEAIQGKLIPQIKEEGTAQELLEQIRQEKFQLVKDGKLKKSALTDSVIYKGDDNKYFEKVGKTEQDITDEIPFEIPDDWKWCRIGSVLNIWSARRVHERDWRSSGIPFYRAREIGKMADWGHVDNDLFIEQSLYDEFSKSGVPQIGDLMMTAVGTLGKTYVVETNNPFYYKDGSVLCIGNPFRLNPYYLKLFFESSAFANQYLSESDGTTVATLTMVRLNRYLIPVPPLKEQTRIVEKIKTVTSIMSR